MVDIKLKPDGDIDVLPTGDITLTDSVVQAVVIRLRWIYQEWRFGPQYGFPWFEEVFVKNPNFVKIKSLLRNEIVQVDGVTDASVDDVVFNKAKRTCRVLFACYVGEERYREEVELYG